MMEQRKHKRRAGKTKNGRSTVFIECPFCKTEVEAFIWSLAGSGKKCPKCGAVHKWSSGMSTYKNAAQHSMQADEVQASVLIARPMPEIVYVEVVESASTLHR